MYGIYEVNGNDVFVFMTETRYQRAYFFDRKEAETVCKLMNENSRYKYEVREM